MILWFSYLYSYSYRWFLQAEVRIYKRKQESKKKSFSFFLVTFLVERVFSSFFSWPLFYSYFLVFFYKFPPPLVEIIDMNFGQNISLKPYSLFSENLNKQPNTFVDMIFCLNTFFCINKIIVFKLFCFLIGSCVWLTFKTNYRNDATFS